MVELTESQMCLLVILLERAYSNIPDEYTKEDLDELIKAEIASLKKNRLTTEEYTRLIDLVMIKMNEVRKLPLLPATLEEILQEYSSILAKLEVKE